MLKASVEVVNVHALLQTGNVIQMFAETAGSGEFLPSVLQFVSELMIFIVCHISFIISLDFCGQGGGMGEFVLFIM